MEKFLVYVEEIEALKELSNEEMGVFIRAMVYFVKTGIVPELSEKMRYAFRFVVAHIARDQKKYADVSEKRRNSGKKGAQVTWEKKKGQDIQLEKVEFVSEVFEESCNNAVDDICESFKEDCENNANSFHDSEKIKAPQGENIPDDSKEEGIPSHLKQIKAPQGENIPDDSKED